MGMNRAVNIIILTMAILVFVSFFMFFYPGLVGGEKNNYLILGLAFLAPAVAAANYIMGKSKWFNLAIGLLCVFLILGVSVARIYLDTHWASDILPAYIIGFMMLAVVILQYLRRKPASWS